MEKNDKQVRQCVVCGVTLPKKRGRPALVCQTHKAERNKLYYQDNKERIAERQRRYYQDNGDRIVELKRWYYQDNGMNDVYAVEAELGIRRITNRCQTCGKKVTANSKYITYCSHKCYRAAFRGYNTTRETK